MPTITTALPVSARLDGHRQLLPRLFSELRPGDVLALQMSDNLREPSHVLMMRLA